MRGRMTVDDAGFLERGSLQVLRRIVGSERATPRPRSAG